MQRCQQMNLLKQGSFWDHLRNNLSTTKNSGNYPAKTFGASITHNTLSDTRLLTYLKCNTLIVLCWTKCSVSRAYLDGPLSEIRKRGPGFLAFLEINFLLLLVKFFFHLFSMSLLWLPFLKQVLPSLPLLYFCLQ